MDRLVVDGWGKLVCKEDNQVVVKEGGKVVQREIASNLRQVLITGSGSLTSDSILLLAENGVDVLFLNWKGEVTARISCPEMRTVGTRKEQYYAYKDKRSGILAKSFVYGKVKNQYALLGTFAKSRKESDVEKAEFILKGRESLLGLIEDIAKVNEENIDKIRDELIGLEGKCSAIYWDCFSKIIPEGFSFEGRSGRYATDGVNAMLNYGYGMLECEVWRCVHFAGLDPYCGYLHADRPGKPSMVLDLMEEFRQQVVDKSVVALVSKKMIQPSQSSLSDGIFKLSDDARKTLMREILEKLEDYTRVDDEKIRWCDLILKQARQVGKYLRGEVLKYEPFYLRW